MVEIHKRVFRSHSSGSAIAHKASSAEYYWLHELRDIKEFARKCTKCQYHDTIAHSPPLHLMEANNAHPRGVSLA